MSEQRHSRAIPDPVEELAEQLLLCGGVLSQLIRGMVEYEITHGGVDPNAVPIPDVAQSLVSGVLDRVRKRFSKRDIRVAASIVEAATDAISEDIFVVDPDWIDAQLN